MAGFLDFLTERRDSQLPVCDVDYSNAKPGRAARDWHTALTISEVALYVIFCRLHDLCATCGGGQLPSAVSIEKLQ